MAKYSKEAEAGGYQIFPKVKSLLNQKGNCFKEKVLVFKQLKHET